MRNDRCFTASDVTIPLCLTDWKDIDGFTWEEYLAQTHSQAVAARAFKMVRTLKYLVSLSGSNTNSSVSSAKRRP